MEQKNLTGNLVLIGFMGSGKSTVAEYMKQAFGMHVIEMDEMIAEKEGMTIPEIFAVHGEAYFRKLETKLLIETQAVQHTVISCGGGAALREENVVEMKKNGTIVLLTAKPETILERVKNDEERPILKGKKKITFIRQLLSERQEAYEKAADIIIETDGKSAEEICEEIFQKLTQNEMIH